MAEEKLYTEGVVPGDMSGDESWLGGPSDYEVGECEFRIEGYKPARDGKKGIIIVFKIENGPEKNKGRSMSRTFILSKEARPFFKGFCEAIAGPDAFIKGEANMKAICGARFGAPIYSRNYTDKDGNPKVGYDINFKAMHDVKRAGAAGNAAPGFEPAS